MVRGMNEHDDGHWLEGTVLTKINPKDIAETVIFAILWPPMSIMLRAGQWIQERRR